MPKLQTLSIEAGEDLQGALSKIARQYRHLNFFVLEPPQSLMGNFKVLKMTVRGSQGDSILKVDGPGFLVDRLYAHFQKA